MFTTNLLAIAALAATGLATNLHVNKGCIIVGSSNNVCADDGAYSINGDTAQVICKLDASPTYITVSWPAYYGDIYWTEEDCLEDAQGNIINGQCA